MRKVKKINQGIFPFEDKYMSTQVLFMLYKINELVEGINELNQGQKKAPEIDHSIDVSYEPDLIAAFDKFIEKWCGEHAAHLLDSDENDGEFIRNKIRDILTS